MRALIIASVSRAIVIEPSSTSDTNCLTRSLPRSRAAASRPIRPWSTIWSRRPGCAVSGANVVCGVVCDASAIAGPSLGAAQLRLQPGALVFVGECRLQDLIELVAPLQRPAQVGELRAQLEQLAQRLHLPRHLVGREVVQALEMEV